MSYPFVTSAFFYLTLVSMMVAGPILPAAFSQQESEGKLRSVLETKESEAPIPELNAPQTTEPNAPIESVPTMPLPSTNPQAERGPVSIGGKNGINAGGGQGLRFGPPRAGVQYGGGQGVRFGTPNIGVQYGGGQILRWGTPNAGVKVGGGEGVRIGTSRGGIKFTPGRGLQIGRFRY